MKRRILAALLCLSLVFSLFGCTQTPDETQGTDPIETTMAPTTEPPPTEPDPAELYAQAREAVDEAANLELAVTYTRKRSVGGETYSESASQTVAMQGIGGDNLQISLTDTTTCGEYVFSSQEYYANGNVFTMFDNLPFTAEITGEDYLNRLFPAVLVDASLYGSVTAQPGADATVLTFSEPTAGESWIVPEGAELLSATGTAAIDENGSLKRTGYTVSYLWGSTQVDLDVSVSVTIPESLSLSNTLPAGHEEYVRLDYIDAPALMYRAVYDIMQTQKVSFRSIDTMISYAGGIIYSQQENLDIHGTGADTMMNHTLEISLQNYTGVLDSYELSETLQDNVLKYTEDDSDPASQRISDSQVEDVRESFMDTILDFMWSPSDLTGAAITDLGSVYLLEFTGNDALGAAYEADAVSMFWGDETFLMEMADAYETAKLDAYLSIDKYTELPVAFGFSYEGVHVLEGEEYSLTDQWDQTMFLGSNTAYTAVTEEPLPDVEPETKATPLFYHVTGENGQEMWLLGTIHVGDDRTGFLPQEIYDALESADALAVEFDMDAFDEALEDDETLLAQVQDAYFYADGSQTKDHIEEDVYDAAVKLLKASGNYYMNAEYLKPYLWSQSIDNFNLQQGYGLVSEKGVDNRLLALARDMEKEILDIESGLFQVQMLTGYSDKLQQLLLEESLATDSAAYCESVSELYELWCAGDEEALREELSGIVDTSELTEEELAEYEELKPLYDEYDKAMSYDRNIGMLNAAIGYLESGDVIFYAVGLAHLLDGTNGLVDALRNAGYTVELVSYQ